jgi:hypothetical protein
MTPLTKQQRQAVKRVYDREPVWGPKNQTRWVFHSALPPEMPTPRGNTYREFRATVQTTVGCGGAVILPWIGMWLAIEPDGYTHS